MIIDEELTFCKNQEITTGTIFSEKTIDQGQNDIIPGTTYRMVRDFGQNSDVPIFIQVTEDFVGGSSVSVAIQMDDNSDFNSPETVGISTTLQTDDLKAGKKFSINVSPLDVNQRYIRLRFTVTGTYTAGKVYAGLTTGVDTNVY